MVGHFYISTHSFTHYIFWFVLLRTVMTVMSLGIKIYYIVRTNNKPDNDTDKIIMWTLLLIFTGSISAIVCYFVKILPLKEIDSTLTTKYFSS